MHNFLCWQRMSGGKTQLQQQSGLRVVTLVPFASTWRNNRQMWWKREEEEEKERPAMKRFQIKILIGVVPTAASSWGRSYIKPPTSHHDLHADGDTSVELLRCTFSLFVHQYNSGRFSWNNWCGRRWNKTTQTVRRLQLLGRKPTEEAISFISHSSSPVQPPFSHLPPTRSACVKLKDPCLKRGEFIWAYMA